MRAVEQVCAADDVAYALVGIVEGRGKEIGDDILALSRQDHVADPGLRFGRVDPVRTGMGGAGLVKEEISSHKDLERGIKVKPKRVSGQTGRHAAAPAGAGIDVEGDTFLRSRKRCADVRARAGAGVEKVFFFKGFQAGVVVGDLRGLAVDRPVPADPQPAQVFLDQRVVFGFATVKVGVFHPEQELAPCSAGHVMRKDGGIGVAQMQRAGWAGREAGYESHAVKEAFARSV